MIAPVPHNGLAVEALAPQLCSGCMEHLSANAKTTSDAWQVKLRRATPCTSVVHFRASGYAVCTPGLIAHLECASLRLATDHRRYAGLHDASFRSCYGFQAAACALEHTISSL